MVGPTDQAIIDLYNQRKIAAAPWRLRAETITRVYNGTEALPLPELDANEASSVANIIAIGLDQSAMRVASVMPDVRWAVPDLTNDKSRKRSELQREATLSWWRATKLPRKMRRRARWLRGYGSAPVTILPDPTTKLPVWALRSPLSTYPPPQSDPDEVAVDDCVFTHNMTIAAAIKRFPDKRAGLETIRLLSDGRDEGITVLEYLDAEVVVWIAYPGDPSTTTSSNWNRPTSAPAPLRLAEDVNRTGVCLASVPGRITLDRLAGAYDQVVPIWRTQAKIMALFIHGMERGILPEEWLVAGQGQTPQVITMADARQGKMGMISGGTIQEVTPDPSYLATPMMSHLERAARMTGGVPSDYSGESASNVRTGARASALLSATVDFPIQEDQETFAAALEHENALACRVSKAWSKGAQSFYFSDGKYTVKKDYDPEKDFQTYTNFVRYPLLGSDMNTLNAQIGQMVGIGLMSKGTARSMHPGIESPEKEQDAIVGETLNEALLAGLASAAAAGSLSPVDLASIHKAVTSDAKSLADAVVAAQEAAQERQAKVAPPGSPEGQPGIGPPSAVEGVPTPAAQAPSPARLASLLSSLAS